MLLIDMDSRSFSVCGIRRWRGGESLTWFQAVTSRLDVDNKKKKRGENEFIFLLFVPSRPSFISLWHLANAFGVKRHICIRPSLSIFTPCPMIDVSFQRVHPCYPQGWINHRRAAICREYTDTHTHAHVYADIHIHRCWVTNACGVMHI